MLQYVMGDRLTTDDLEWIIDVTQKEFCEAEGSGLLKLDVKEIGDYIEEEPYTLVMITDDQERIGYIFAFPVSERQGRAFANKEITEAELFEKSTLQNENNALYFCAAYVSELRREEGIATKGIKYMIRLMNENSILYGNTMVTWTLTEEGHKLAQSVSLKKGMQLMELREY